MLGCSFCIAACSERPDAGKREAEKCLISAGVSGRCGSAECREGCCFHHHDDNDDDGGDDGGGGGGSVPLILVVRQRGLRDNGPL